MPDQITVEADEIIEGESRAVTVIDQGIVGAGTYALAALTDEAFEARLAAMVKNRERVQKIQRALMVEGVHFGTIPGTDKPTLLQPGAELLCDVYRLRADFQPRREIGDGIIEPSLSYLTRCDLHLGSLDGPVIATGYGAANSWEKRYRWRNAERACPNCGKSTVIKGKAEFGGGWLCWAKKGGCNSKWKDGDAAIEGQDVGQMENPDPFDLDVVLDAMAAKRAFVHATRRGCAVSDLFTSDTEDLPENEQHRPIVENGGMGSGNNEADTIAQRGAFVAAVKPAHPAGPHEELLGTITKAGTIRMGGGEGYKLEARDHPEGKSLGFRLEVDADKAIPQVIIEGQLGADVIDATGGKPEELAGKWAKVRGRLYSVSQAGRTTYTRLRVTSIETREWTLPPEVVPGVAVPDAAVVPMFSADDEAELDKAAELENRDEVRR